MRVETKTDKIINNKVLLENELLSFKQLKNNVNFYFFSYFFYIEKYGKYEYVQFAHAIFSYRFLDQAYSSNSILIGVWADKNWDKQYTIVLILFKEPYKEISKTLVIEDFIHYHSFKLIGLKDYFIFIKIDENENLHEGNYTYKILDLNLNLINSLTVKYTNYSRILFSELSENSEINEFIMCIKYYNSITECQIIVYENLNLTFSEPYKIFSRHEIDNYNRYYGCYLSMNLFDENKIRCYLLSTYRNTSDHVTILQYENKKLFYFQNIQDIQIPSIQDEVSTSANVVKIINTDKGIGLLAHSYNIYLYYISSICITKNISLYPNLLKEFPINELISPGIDQLEFSFIELHKDLSIYKNSIEIKIGQILNDLNNFTYFLKIDKSFKDSFSIKVKSHKYDYICDININIIIETNISTYKESHKCLKNKSYGKINNITYSNLFNYFNINNKSFVQFEFMMENEPKENELIFYFNNYTINCLNNSTTIICNPPLSIFPRLKIIHLYSYLSCYNLIDVGWFEINDENISSIYSLINYNFDEISEIYDPSTKITEYNPAMINYYYWFSCFSYCDDYNIGQKSCCNNIMNEWEIVFHKEYSFDQNLIDFIIDLVLEVVGSKNTFDDLEYDDYVADIIGQSSENIGKIYRTSKNAINSNSILIPIAGYLSTFLYQYNFVILKNDEYKKIVVAFPGITYYFQIIEELIHSGMVKLPFKSGNKVFNVLEMYYNIFTIIEKDLFDNLASLPEINKKNYQVIFTGHSLGGAIATISSFYYIKKYNFTAENILITFGQPKVGSEVFAKELTSNLKQIYRIARPNDIGTQFPLKGIDLLFKYFKTLKLFKDLAEFIVTIGTGNYLSAGISFINFIRNIGDTLDEYSYLFEDRSFQDSFYSHIGGLYMIDDDTNTVYHCDDFFNEKRDHFICKNHNIKLSLSIFDNFLQNRKYLNKSQDMINSCQNKKLKIFRFSPALTAYNHLLRILGITHNINNYSIKRNRKLNNIQKIQEILILFKEINLKRNKYEFFYKYESKEILKIDNLILIINPKSNLFFGEICFSQNITWLINNEFDFITCYFVNIKNPFTLKIELEKEIINEKELYIYIKGKVYGTLELYDITKNKTLNISSSYYIPYIYNFSSEHTINFIMPKLDENIYMNIIINDYSFNENKNFFFNI